MPKTKAYISSSDDSISGDEQPKPKKSKTAVKKKDDSPPPKSSGGVKVGNEVRFELGKLKFATVSEFKGRKMVNIREFYMTAEGELRPGKKGLALMPDQWEKLKANMDEIDTALDNL